MPYAGVMMWLWEEVCTAAYGPATRVRTQSHARYLEGSFLWGLVPILGFAPAGGRFSRLDEAATDRVPGELDTVVHA